MFKNHLDIRLKHEKFIAKVCETKIVYGLENEEGFATSSSNEFEDENGEAIGIICFWSEKALANVCARKYWSSYEPIEVDLSEFMENWCIGIENDGLLVGTNFDQNLFGFEIEGYDLILELIQELKRTKQELEFEKFKDLADFEQQLKEALGS